MRRRDAASRSDDAVNQPVGPLDDDRLVHGRGRPPRVDLRQLELDGHPQARRPAARRAPGAAAAARAARPARAVRTQPGDDARRIDWTSRPARRRCTCATPSPTASWRRGSSSTPAPASTSAPRRGRSVTSRVAAAAAFGLLAARAGNRTAALSSTADHRRSSRRAPGATRSMQLLRRARAAGRAPRSARPRSPTRCARSVRAAKRRGRVVVVSDLIDQGDWANELRSLAARHDLVVAEITRSARVGAARRRPADAARPRVRPARRGPDRRPQAARAASPRPPPQRRREHADADPPGRRRPPVPVHRP